MTSVMAPDLLEELVPATVVPVELITDRIFLVVVLVVVLSRGERTGRGDLGDDFFFERARLLERGFRRFGGLLLRLVVVENGAPVLAAVVAELRVLRRRVDVVPEDVE